MPPSGRCVACGLGSAMGVTRQTKALMQAQNSQGASTSCTQSNAGTDSGNWERLGMKAAASRSVPECIAYTGLVSRCLWPLSMSIVATVPQMYVEENAQFQLKVVEKSGLNRDGTYLPPAIHPTFAKEPKYDMKTAMIEAEMVMGGVVSDLLEKTGIVPNSWLTDSWRKKGHRVRRLHIDSDATIVCACRYQARPDRHPDHQLQYLLSHTFTQLYAHQQIQVPP